MTTASGFEGYRVLSRARFHSINHSAYLEVLLQGRPSDKIRDCVLIRVTGVPIAHCHASKSMPFDVNPNVLFHLSVLQVRYISTCIGLPEVYWTRPNGAKRKREGTSEKENFP